MKLLDNFLDIFRGQAISIPPMVGALRPNTLLDEAAVLAETSAPDNLVYIDGVVCFSSANSLFTYNASDPETSTKAIKHFEAEISCMAERPGGGYALGLNSGEIHISDGNAEQILPAVNGILRCPTAMTFADNNTLIICQGSRRVRPAGAVHDLMQRGDTGSIWEIDLMNNNERCLGEKLAFPYGVAVSEDKNSIIVSECWTNRLLKLPRNGAGNAEPALSELPGYPSRLIAANDGGFWLCLFAPRNRLIEFVLQEDELRKQMTETIAPQYWIAPALSSGNNFMEPLQKGGVKTMGVHKPWSPSFSYGFLVKLDSQFQATKSFHSRANGNCHGISSVCQIGDRVIISSKGNNKIIEITPTVAGGAK